MLSYFYFLLSSALFLLLFSVLLFLFQGKFWQRLIVYWYFDIIKVICETAAFVPILLFRGYHGEWAEILSFVESNTSLKTFYMLTFLALFLLVGFFSLKMWRRLLLKSFQPLYLLFIALPMGQIYSFALVIHPNMGDLIFGILINFTSNVGTLYYILAIFGILLCLASDLVLLVYAISQEKRTALEAELHEIRHHMALERSHYRELERRREELAKIRHDFNNQLASIGQLIRSGEKNAAQNLIDSLEAEIKKIE